LAHLLLVHSAVHQLAAQQSQQQQQQRTQTQLLVLHSRVVVGPEG
jgi:hypothetical protein